MYVQNQGSCVDSITKPLIISPYYDLATDYFEDFNANYEIGMKINPLM